MYDVRCTWRGRAEGARLASLCVAHSVCTLGLERMRSAVTVIPQDPTLHKGTVAHNLDPFGASDEEAMKGVLRRTRLPEAMLHAQVERGDANHPTPDRSHTVVHARTLQLPIHSRSFTTNRPHPTVHARSFTGREGRRQPLLRRTTAVRSLHTHPDSQPPPVPNPYNQPMRSAAPARVVCSPRAADRAVRTWCE
jgi:hypothetical protein